MKNRRNRSHQPVDGTFAVFMLIAINVAIPVLFGFTNRSLYVNLGLSPMGLKELKIWQFVTSMFLHGGIGHLFVNMWGLYLFGTFIAKDMGPNKFLWLYFISGICGGLLFILFNFNSPVLCIGASGALFGVMVAAAMMVPDVRIMLLIPPIPMKMKTFIIVYALIETLMSAKSDGVAHLAHIGGLIGGYIFMKIFYRNTEWDPLGGLWSALGMSSGTKITGRRPPAGWDINDYTNKPTSVSQADLDRILDKISSQGINSLSEEEMAVLRKAREEMKKK